MTERLKRRNATLETLQETGLVFFFQKHNLPFFQPTLQNKKPAKCHLAITVHEITAW